MQRPLAANPPDRVVFPERSKSSLEQGGTAGALRVLVVDDDDAVRAACATMAGSFGCHVRIADSVPAARSVLAETTVDVVFLDMRLPGGSGDILLEEIRTSQPRTFVVIMTAYATVSSAVELMRNGAGHFLQKPFALDQVTSVLEDAAKRRMGSETSRVLQDRLQAGIGAGRLIGESLAMQKLFRIVSKVAFTRHPVLIQGESGTGKEVVARAIHANGPTALSPFVPIDCDSLLPAQLEGELFGYDESTRDGGRSRPGLFATTEDGTVYLDEIGALSQHLQARLARTLEDRLLRSPGAARAVPLRARVLASSRRDLQAMVNEGRFRKDLFYRLNVVNLRVPSLRDRREDIPLLAEHFLARQRREYGIPFILSDKALQTLHDYHWSGNVGELESLIEHACALSTGPVLHFDDLSTQLKAFVTATEPAAPAEANHTAEDRPLLTIQEMERQAITHALHQLHGDKLLAAKVLGIGKTTLYRKLKEYGIADDAA